MKRTLKPYFSAAKSKFGDPKNIGLVSDKTIKNSTYMKKCGKKKK